MRAAAFDYRADFYSVAVVADGGGGFDETPALEFARWAKFDQPRFAATSEELEAGAVAPRSEAILTVRRDPETQAIDASWTVQIDGVEWSIKEVRDRRALGLIDLAIELGGAL